jgi:antitoxin component YwqK of YwqJK toxin-antitoxin module
MDTRYQTSIPPAAVERIVSTHPDGSRRHAEYVLEGEVVGHRWWDEDGSLSRETPFMNGVKHGVEYIFYASGNLVSAEPYERGQMHGLTEQWDRDGRLIGTYTMVHGTGIDLWRWVRPDGSISLSEVRYYKDGHRHGFEWWINWDQQQVSEEQHFREGEPHGIHRDWNVRDRLSRGFPKYYVNGRKVTKRQYLAACKTDATLPPFRVEENDPARTFPPEIQRELGTPVWEEDSTE